ncbi:MAG: GFA family protein [Pseudomonadota bacterium]
MKRRLKSTCHCGEVELEITVEGELASLSRCDCSLCSRRGAVMASVPLADLKVVKGAERLTLYQFHTRTAEHYFCSRCGIYTHHRRRSDPSRYAFNVACIEGVDPAAVYQDAIVDPHDFPEDHQRHKQ